MNIRFRLLRKPFTTLLWALLVTVMTVLLCIGGALWYSSESAAEIINGLHSTVAYRTDRAYQKPDKANGVSYSFENKTLSADSKELLENLDSVEGVYIHTLTGGYSPDFRALCGSYGYMTNESYDNVVVVATITKIEYPHPSETWTETLDLSRMGLGIVTTGSVDVYLHVEEYYVANADYIGIGTPRESWDLFMVASFLRQEDLSYLEEGQRYLINGRYDASNFSDPMLDISYHLLPEGNSLRGHGTTHYAPVFSEEEQSDIPVVESMDEEDLCMARLDGTVEEFLGDPANEEWKRIIETNRMAQSCVPILGTENLESMYLFTNSQASIQEGRFFTPEEYASGEKVCILSSNLAERSGIQLGDTIPISQFWCVDESGSGMDNYSTDLHATDGKLNNPTVGHVGAATEFITRDEEFTVVGIYRQRNEWNQGSYDLTPNTVFIPKKAQIPGGFGGFSRVENVTYINGAGENISTTKYAQEAAWGVYLSVKLKNGMADDFREAIAGTALEGQFIITDQGYSAILDSIRSVSKSARSLFALVGAGWALLVLLYILLYQGSQRRNIGIMRSLGATPREAHRYLWGSGMTVATLGVAVGIAVSAGVMGIVQQLLYDAATTTVKLSQYSVTGPTQQSFRELLAQSQLPVWVLLMLGGAQLLVFAAAMYFQSRKLANQEPRTLLGA